MKIKFVMTGLLGLVAISAFAQKSELNNAQETYNKYETLRGSKNLAAPLLVQAKASIDKAAANDKTSGLPQTIALKGIIYASAALADTVPATSIPLFTTAEESLKKAKEVDTKGDFKKMTDAAYSLLAQYQLNKGIKEYGNKQFDLAYKSFDYYRTVMPEDTIAIYYTGLAAANAKNWDAAITNYNKLLTTPFKGKERAYQELSGFHLAKQTKADTLEAIKTLEEASTKYPSNADISKTIVELNLQMGRQQEVISKVEKAIANDPKNKTLYYYSGLTYSEIADDASQKLAKAPAAQQAALTKTRDENLAKAQDMYKKALEIDPNYFEANLNMGYVLITPAIDLYNYARKLDVKKQKEYDASMAKANSMFDAAKPFLQKAVDLNPKSVSALTNLRTYYLGKNDMANATKIKQQLDALQSGK